MLRLGIRDSRCCVMNIEVNASRKKAAVISKFDLEIIEINWLRDYANCS